MTTPAPFAVPDALRIVTWNINRGQRLSEVIEFLAGTAADLILLQEADWNARRTHCLNVAQEIARALAMNYVFGCEFEELTQGHNGMPAYHGQATLSRLPILSSRILSFRRQSRFWHPRWFIPRTRPFQRRLGGRIALISHFGLPERKLIVYNVHLEAKERMACGVCSSGSFWKTFRSMLRMSMSLLEVTSTPICIRNQPFQPSAKPVSSIHSLTYRVFPPLYRLVSIDPARSIGF